MDVETLRCRPAAALLGLLLLCSQSAIAQTPSPLPEWYYSQGHLLERHMLNGLPKWEGTAGLAAETQPKYEGGNAYQTSGGPAFDLRYRDIAFASTGEGFGINVLRNERYRAGLALTFDMGRSQRDDHHLTGLGNLGVAPEAKVFAEYMVVFPLVARVDVRRAFGGEGGWIGDFSLYSPVSGSEIFFVFAGPSLTFADSDNLRHTFGVSPTQSAASGYPVHDAGKGLRSGSFAVDGGYFFTKNWLIEGAVAAEKLFGGAGDSPFVQERSQFAMTISGEYRWQ